MFRFVGTCKCLRSDRQYRERRRELGCDYGPWCCTDASKTN